MGKHKKKKFSLSEKVNQVKTSTSGKVNPFEIRYNRQKHNIVGRKQSKREMGRPGVARARAIEKRKSSLLVEYQKLKKANKFVDKRFGEYDDSLTAEDKMMQRFAFERKKVSGKSHIYNLNDAMNSDSEELTHYGQSLSEIEKFDKPKVSISDDEDEDDGNDNGGKLSAEYVSKIHFGGGMLSKKKEKVVNTDMFGEERPGGGGGEKSHKELIEEMISKTRQLRHEAQREKEAGEDLTQQLDDKWRELRGAVVRRARADEGKEQAATSSSVSSSAPAPGGTDYDVLVRQLRFEARGTPTERLKTEEELAREEKEKLEEMELMRQQKMLCDDDADVTDAVTGLTSGSTNSNKRREKRVRFSSASQHVSADDLHDNCAVSKADKKRKSTFIYYDMEGKMRQRNLNGDEEEGGHDDNRSITENGNNSNEGDEDSNTNDEVSEENDEVSDDNDGDSNGDDDDSDEDEDSFSDIAESDDEECSSSDDIEDGVKSKGEEQKTGSGSSSVKQQEKSQLPFVFDIPVSYPELHSLLSPHTTADQQIICDRVYKCHHPSLADTNKQKLQVYYSLLLQYLGRSCTSRPDPDMLDYLTRHLHQLAKHFPLHAASCLTKVISDAFRRIARKGGKRRPPPPLSTLVYVKLVPAIFQTSDRRHAVCTPTLIYTCHLLARCPLNTRPHLSTALFICAVLVEFVSYSKRVIPEAVNCLYNLLVMASRKDKHVLPKFAPPLKPIGSHVNLLVITENCKEMEAKPLSILSELGDDTEASNSTTIDNQYKLDALHSILKLVQLYSKLYEYLPAYRELFTPIREQLKRLPLDYLPVSMLNAIETLGSAIDETSSKPRKMLTGEKPKPKFIKLVEPKIEENFDLRKTRKKGNKEFNERQKLLHKHRREMKSAVREIKKDSQFLAREQLQEQLQKDAERNEKVKRIYSMLANQEGEYRNIKRQKVKVKF